ncbi:AfsR/SARP family transcriptional regulator [Kribbella albertanoniae]|uniref:AfsR/SARP family transcriptional regulator n=1 Tax=Kribbella albertanoniae TaxID=1266829 RepID=UPI0014051191|nr:AfsR/SARP family transcriptional regulator [Kribbella albertanoniae]
MGSSPRQRVLALLLLHPNTPVDVSKLIEAGPLDGPEQLRVLLEELRDLVDPHRLPGVDGALIELSDGRPMLCLERADLDLFRFEDGLAEARKLRDRDQRAQSAEAYRTALANWRGEPLAGLHGPLFDKARRWLEDLRIAALEDMYEVELAAGRHEEVLSELSALTAQYPLRERIRAALMVALYRVGRQAQALAEYDDYRTRLDSAHQMLPSLALKALWARMVNFDPLLMLPVPATDLKPAPRPNPPVGQSVVVARALLGAILPVVTCGIGASVAFVVLAVARRRWRLLLAAAVYAVPSALFLFPDSTDAFLISSPLILLSVGHLLAALHAPHRRWWPRTWWPYRKRTRAAARIRESWRRYANYDPEAVRRAGVGRPDLRLGTDDGGLVELNGAPAEVLATLPGVTAEVAARILQQRLWPPLTRVEELETRGILTVTDDLRDRVLILPVRNSVGAARQNPMP